MVDFILIPVTELLVLFSLIKIMFKFSQNRYMASTSSLISLSTNVLIYLFNYFLFQPVLHDWCNKGRGMCYPVWGMVHIKEPLLLIGKSRLCGGSGFPFSLSEWSLTICLTSYNCK